VHRLTEILRALIDRIERIARFWGARFDVKDHATN
jgi:hypothetical protein